MSDISNKLKISKQEKEVKAYFSDRLKMIGSVVGVIAGFYVGLEMVDALYVQDIPPSFGYGLEAISSFLGLLSGHKVGDILGNLTGYAAYNALKLNKRLRKKESNLEKKLIDSE